MFKKLKNKKGFTLVELIVVLVILAILAALLVPALTGYIDKAREQSLISKGSMVLTAAQATVSEAYGTGDIKVTKENTVYKVEIQDDTNKTATKAMNAQIKELSESDGNASWSFSVKVGDEKNYKSVKIDTLVYSDGTNAIVYSNGNWGHTQKGVKNVAGVTIKDYNALVTGGAENAENK